MRLFILGLRWDEVASYLRMLSYRDKEEDDGSVSFVRPFFEKKFPRFHAGVKNLDNGAQLTVHLDQANIDHQGNHQWVWTYGGPLVAQELERIETRIKDFQKRGILPTKPKRLKKSPWRFIYKHQL